MLLSKGDKNMENATLLSVYNELIAKLRGLSFIESLTLIGEPVKKRSVDKIMDIDIVIIVKEPMAQKYYDKIKEVCERVCAKYTNPSIDVIYSTAVGPMKPKSFKGQEIFLHCLVHTAESYKNSPLHLVKLSWQKYKPISGTHLKKIQSYNGITKDMLLNSALGINHLIELVSKDQSSYLDWEKGKGCMQHKIFPLQFKHDDEKADLYMYAVLRCASNMLRLHTGDNKVEIGKKMTNMFIKNFPEIKSNEFPQQIVNEKSLLRNKRYAGDIFKLKEKTLDFLNELKHKLEA